jgi:hypothetical protein
MFEQYTKEENLNSTGRIFQVIKTTTLNYIIQAISFLIVKLRYIYIYILVCITHSNVMHEK